MDKAESIQKAYDVLTALLSPVCVEYGLSFKTMPSDADAGTVRRAMAIAFVPGFDTDSKLSPEQMTARQVGLVKISAYVIVLAASQVGPASATWAIEIVVKALHNRTYDGVRVLTDSTMLTSFKDGIWQYRVPVSLSLPYCSENVEAMADTEQLPMTW